MEIKKIQEFKRDNCKNFLDELAKLAGAENIDDAILQGYSINELVKYGKQANINIWDTAEEICSQGGTKRYSPRRELEKYLNLKFGDFKLYFRSEPFIKHKQDKMEATMMKRYGVKNNGQFEKHRENMRKGPKCTNPFSDDKFKIRAYIRGVGVLPEDKEAFNNYSLEVDIITKNNRDMVEFTGVDYYTGDKIFKYDGNKTVNRNDWNCATLDHKISVLKGFLNGISPEIIGGVDNLCWTSKYFNGFKQGMTEQELKLSGIIERYKEVRSKLINEDSRN